MEQTHPRYGGCIWILRLGRYGGGFPLYGYLTTTQDRGLKPHLDQC